MGVLDDLLANPGLYLGLNRDPSSGKADAARMLISPLPGRAGVTIDYETFNPAAPDRVRGHAERSVLARTPLGEVVLVVGHVHADTIALLRETEPGVFVAGPSGSAFPVSIRVSMPEPGLLKHAWWYGMPGEAHRARRRLSPPHGMKAPKPGSRLARGLTVGPSRHPDARSSHVRRRVIRCAFALKRPRRPQRARGSI